MNSSWFLRPMAVLRITEYPNSMDRYYRQLPNTNEGNRFQSTGQQGEKETAEQKSELCYFGWQGQV